MRVTWANNVRASSVMNGNTSTSFLAALSLRTSCSLHIIQIMVCFCSLLTSFV